MTNPKHKNRIQSAFSKSPTEWVDIIQQKVAEPCMQGWLASVIWWDMALDELSDKGARYLQPLEALTEQYTPEAQKLCLTPDLSSALTAVGYDFAEVRCSLKTDIPEGENLNLRGAYTAIDHRWSTRTTNGVSHA